MFCIQLQDFSPLWTTVVQNQGVLYRKLRKLFRVGFMYIINIHFDFYFRQSIDPVPIYRWDQNKKLTRLLYNQKANYGISPDMDKF
jgi:hypothetical protein